MKTQQLERLRKAIRECEAQPHSFYFDYSAEKIKATVRRRALLLLDHRARSRKELHDRLYALDFDVEVIDEVIDELERDQLVNDELFAQEWVRQRHHRRGKSRIVLNAELKAKGIPTELRETALKTIADADEATKAYELAVKKAATIKVDCGRDCKEYDKALRRILGILARRGFPESMAVRIAKTALNERLDELRGKK